MDTTLWVAGTLPLELSYLKLKAIIVTLFVAYNYPKSLLATDVEIWPVKTRPGQIDIQCPNEAIIECMFICI